MRGSLITSPFHVLARHAGELALALAVLDSACTNPARRTAVAPPAAAVDRNLRVLFAAIDARWNTRDAAGLAELHAGDADVWIGSGPRMRGREAIRESFGRSFAAAPASLRHRTLVEDTSLLTPDVASADGRIQLEDTRGDSTVVVRRMTFSAVAVRAPAGWRVRLVRIHPETADRAAAPPRRDP
jgi:uncharacterized protein (TIGR02246 family)